MYPILFRYLLGSYFKTFSLCVGSFVSILVVSRFKEIARFAVISSDFLKTALFLLYQIPFILPFAFPIATLIASFLLSHRMGQTGELRALSTSGISFRSILSPLFLIAFLLSLVSFSISADLAPLCRRESKKLLFQETASNPFLVLQKKNLLKTPIYLKMDETSLSNILLILPRKGTDELQLFSIDQLEKTDSEIAGRGIGAIGQENQKTLSISTERLSTSFRQDPFSLRHKDLTFRELRLEKTAVTEMTGRLFLALSVFTFTCLGTIFGMDLTRLPSRKNFFPLSFLTLLTLIVYLSLKKFPFPLLLFIASFPHVLTFFFTWRKLKKIR